MANFSEWFENKLIVGGFPYKVDENFRRNGYDIIVNVSDEFYFDIDKKLREKCVTFWFPMNECKRDIGLNSIYGAMVVLHEAEQNNKTVYLHCHSGVNRSPTVADCYHYMRSGKHFERPRSGFVNRLMAQCHRGYLPPKSEMESYLTEIQKNLSNMQGGMLDICKINAIRNF